MGTTTQTVPVDICAIRVALLTEGGSPLTGASNGYVSHSPQMLEVTVELETGDSNTLKNGCNTLVATLNDQDQIKGISFNMDLTQLDPYLDHILTGSSVIQTLAGAAIGGQYPAIGSEPPPVCFEAWAKAWENDHQLVDAYTTPDATYIHLVYPKTRWVAGAATYNHGLNVRPVSGKGYENPSITANGPFDDWPTEVVSAGGITRIGGWFYDSVLPAETGTYTSVTSAAS